MPRFALKYNNRQYLFRVPPGPGLHPIRGTKLHIIQFPRTAEDKSPPQWFIVDEKLGAGIYGSVFKAYPIKDGVVDIDNPIAVKESQHFYEQEVAALQHLSPQLNLNYLFLVDNEGSTHFYIPMPFVKGERSYKANLKNITTSQKLDLICQLIANLMLLHYETPTKKISHAHLDIHGGNIMIHVPSQEDLLSDKKSDRTMNLTLIDFGLAGETKSETNKREGFFNFFYPHEFVSEGIYGTKTDVFILVNVISEILGAPTPLKHRGLEEKEEKKELPRSLSPEQEIFYSKQPFATEDIKDLPEIFGVSLKKLIINFLNKMQSKKMSDRPDTLEVWEFFKTLLNLFKRNELAEEKVFKEDEDRATFLEELHSKNEADLAKLIILEKGLWYLELGPREIKEHKSQAVRVEEVKEFNEPPGKPQKIPWEKQKITYRTAASIEQEEKKQARLSSTIETKKQDLKQADLPYAVVGVKEARNTSANITFENYPSSNKKIIAAYKAKKSVRIMADELMEMEPRWLEKLVSSLLKSNLPPSNVIKQKVNNMREAIVAESIKQLKKMPKTEQDKICEALLKKQNTLGKILHDPRNPSAFTFSLVKYNNQKVTRSIYNILHAIKPEGPISPYSSPHLHR